MDSSAPTLDEIGIVAGALGTSEFFIEKDWHVVRVLALMAGADFGGVQISFSGGTALSKAHSLIRRFSEDIDFRACLTIDHTSNGAKKRARREFYHQVRAVLQDSGYGALDGPSAGNEYRFCQLHLTYPTILNGGPSAGLRPHIQVEISFHPLRMPTADCVVSSFIASHRTESAEVKAVRCVDPVETGADKLSSLVWRLSAAHLGTRVAYQPELARHIHDLAVLAPRLKGSSEFVHLANTCISEDLRRGKLKGNSIEALNIFLEAVAARESLADDYQSFVTNYVYAPEVDRIGFPEARDAIVALCERVLAS